ncbi:MULTISPECIES: hypothetical protein [Saccharothrix]|uniref:hypothetical protein n=1 Tax=Saccharothrix TaxID=2071 RepID=UPI000938D507|nr:hypothetical protein [Saccharothrix sp. CB00851]OKI38705.1 hypothetical protein A6A25_00310 [Saccharothrix sp. CB00851]
MSATTTAGTTTAAPVTKRTRVGWGDLMWLTWRQHRWAIIGMVVAVVAVVAVALTVAWRIDSTGDLQAMYSRWRFMNLGSLVMLAPMAVGLAIAVFWAAPVLAREYEQRTHLVVWSQDISPTRWLVGKVVLLGVPAVALAVVVGLASSRLIESFNAADRSPISAFEMPAFEVVPVVQAGYAAFGFALGLALGALTRRTVLSMGLALGAFLATRVVVAGVLRPNFQAPLREVQTYGAYQRSWDGPGDDSWTVNSGFAGADGQEIPFPSTCADVQDSDAYTKCMDDNGVLFFREYHPAERLVPFQLVESAIFIVLAAGLLALTFVTVRRARRV